jgi:hypothetical protein
MNAVTLLAVLASLPADAPVSCEQHGNLPILYVGKPHGDNDRYIKHLANPAHIWTQHMSRTDSQGRMWDAIGGNFVMDDYGFLVAVTA